MISSVFLTDGAFCSGTVRIVITTEMRLIMFSARKQTKNQSSGCTECSNSEEQVKGRQISAGFRQTSSVNRQVTASLMSKTLYLTRKMPLNHELTALSTNNEFQWSKHYKRRKLFNLYSLFLILYAMNMSKLIIQQEFSQFYEITLNLCL